MCQPGIVEFGSKIQTEIPRGLAAGSRGGSWMAKDMPMLLHTYEYIVRNAILNWWEQTALNNKLSSLRKIIQIPSRLTVNHIPKVKTSCNNSVLRWSFK